MVSLKGGQNRKQYNLKYILLIPHNYGILNYIKITHATRLTLILNSAHHFKPGSMETHIPKQILIGQCCSHLKKIELGVKYKYVKYQGSVTPVTKSAKVGDIFPYYDEESD